MRLARPAFRRAGYSEPLKRPVSKGFREILSRLYGTEVGKGKIGEGFKTCSIPNGNEACPLSLFPCRFSLPCVLVLWHNRSSDMLSEYEIQAMSQIFRCAQGHEWQGGADGPGALACETTKCPLCGGSPVVLS